MPRSAIDAGSAADALLLAGASALGIHLGADAVAAFRIYREELLRWSRRMNLTALATPGQIVQQGLLDSLTCTRLLPPAGGRAIDIGSGAGFPAIPLALVARGLEFTLVEPSRKKATFLRHAIRRLELTTARVRPSRAEALLGEVGMLEVFDVALARAVAPLPKVGLMVWPFLRPAGIFLAQIGSGPSVDHEIDRLTRSGFEAVDEIVVPREFGKTGRRVLALKKLIPR